MDGDNLVTTREDLLIPEPPLREFAPTRLERAPPRTRRWLVIVALLIALVLGGLYGFNAFRQHAIATFFAHNKPPPAQISAVTATVETVPHFATGIGALAAVHQVTVS